MKLFLIMVLWAPFAFATHEITPTIELNQSLEFFDDLNYKNLDLAIERQLKAFNKKKLKDTIQFGQKTYPKTELKESLLLLQKLYKDFRSCKRTDCQAILNKEINRQFDIYVPISSNKTKYTSYYSPDFKGSLNPNEKYKNPIYRKPPGEFDFSRVEIDFRGALAGKNLEIVWVKESLFDLYLLHVQGGGRVQIELPNGQFEMKYLSYDGKNRRRFQMIYHYMIKQGYITPATSSLPHQRQFLNDHPEKQEEIFGQCPSYVYFKLSDQEPVGLDNIPLTEGRSLAIDNTIYKTTGLINFVKTVRTIERDGSMKKIPFSRFFIAQDTGGAIRGNARCDLYFGYGKEAETVAYNMNDVGDQYFLIKK